MTIDGDGQGSAASSLPNPRWIRYFQAAPPATANGDLTVSLIGLDAGLIGWMELWDDTAGTSMGARVGSSAGADVVGSYSGIDPTHSYVLSATSRYYTAGSGALTAEFDFATALPTTINPATDVDLAWTPNQFGDQRYTHPLGTNVQEIRPETAGTLQLEMWSYSTDDVVLGLYDAAGNRLAYDIAHGGAHAAVSQPVTAAGTSATPHATGCTTTPPAATPTSTAS